MRTFIHHHQWPIALVSVTLALMAIVWLFVRDGDAAALAEDQAWYHDVVTGEVFAARAKQIPPIESPDGNEAVRVFFFSCGDCAEGDRFAGYYMKYNSEMKQQLEADPAKFGAAFGESHPGRLYSADAQIWVAAPTVKKSGVAEYLAGKCGDGYLRSCR